MCKVFFFLLRSVGRRDLSAGPEQKNTHHPGCFFFCSGPGERQEKEKPRAGTGPEQKKNTTQGVFFFAAAPAKGKGWAPARGQSKKKHHPGCFFFSLAPCRRRTGLLLPLPFAGAAAKKKNTLGGVFFCSGPVPARGFSFPCLSPGPEQKKNTLGGVFFFSAAPRGRSLTHSLRAWVAMPPHRRGGVFFLLRPHPDRGGVFFCCGPARTLTHSLWAGAISARPGWCFFLLRPRRVFLDNNKKCLGYYIGSKKTRRGHSKKKTPLPS